MSNNSTIKCPNCRHEFPIGNALAEEIENDIKARYKGFLAEERKKMDLEKARIEKEAEELKLKAENQDRILADKLRLEKTKLQEEANKKAAVEQQAMLDMLNKELAEKSHKLKVSQTKELDLIQKEKKIIEREETLKLELEKQLLERQKEIEDRAKKMEGERFDLKIKELEKKLADQVELAEVMRRKAEQGSMQLQGEVLELALEELLRTSYPYDTIEEVAKGTRGADCTQLVRNNVAQLCGKIIYESKRTKSFTNEWIEKLKTDMRATQADIAVIVTNALPKDMDTFGFRDGVWICRFSDVKPLSFLLRDSLVKVYGAMVTQEGKGDKMQLLYNYLTGNEFRQNVEAVVEGFISLKDGITRERAQMEKLWKEREKQIEKVLLNTTQFYGSIKGIAGSAVGDIRALE
jgi:hypothetical protein